MDALTATNVYGIGGGVFLGAVWAAKVWIERAISTTMGLLQSQEIEKFKAYNARLLNNFGLYNQNRHETYAKLYELLLIAQGQLVSRAPTLVTRFTYDEFGEEDIKQLLTDLRVPTKEVERICDVWSQNRDTAREEIYRWQDIVNANEMQKAVQEFHNEYLRRELYLSEPVQHKLDQIDKLVLTAEIYGKRDQLDNYGGHYVTPEIAQVKQQRREKFEASSGSLESLSKNCVP